MRKLISSSTSVEFNPLKQCGGVSLPRILTCFDERDSQLHIDLVFRDTADYWEAFCERIFALDPECMGIDKGFNREFAQDIIVGNIFCAYRYGYSESEIQEMYPCLDDDHFDEVMVQALKLSWRTRIPPSAFWLLLLDTDAFGFGDEIPQYSGSFRAKRGPLAYNNERGYLKSMFSALVWLADQEPILLKNESTNVCYLNESNKQCFSEFIYNVRARATSGVMRKKGTPFAEGWNDQVDTQYTYRHSLFSDRLGKSITEMMDEKILFYDDSYDLLSENLQKHWRLCERIQSEYLSTIYPDKRIVGHKKDITGLTFKDQIEKAFSFFVESIKEKKNPFQAFFLLAKKIEILHVFPDGNGRTWQLLFHKLLIDLGESPMCLTDTLWLEDIPSCDAPEKIRENQGYFTDILRQWPRMAKPEQASILIGGALFIKETRNAEVFFVIEPNILYPYKRWYVNLLNLLEKPGCKIEILEDCFNRDVLRRYNFQLKTGDPSLVFVFDLILFGWQYCEAVYKYKNVAMGFYLIMGSDSIMALSELFFDKTIVQELLESLPKKSDADVDTLFYFDKIIALVLNYRFKQSLSSIDECLMYANGYYEVFMKYSPIEKVSAPVDRHKLFKFLPLIGRSFS